MRPDITVLLADDLSSVLIRDQRPMPPKALMRCLRSGLMPEDWFEFLNF
jgi:hypothetical protein